jgi:hypothetical protein
MFQRNAIGENGETQNCDRDDGQPLLLIGGVVANKLECFFDGQLGFDDVRLGSHCYNRTLL